MKGLSEIARELPLPVAALLRRAERARSAKERHDLAHSAWEASVRLGAFVRLADGSPALRLPSTGDWVRALDAPDHELDDPDALAAYALMTDVGSGKAARPVRVTARKLVDAFPGYRNKVVGHASVRSSEFYHAAADALLGGLVASWRAGVFWPCGARLAFVESVQVGGSGGRVASLVDLTGPQSSMERTDVPADVRPGRAYLREAGTYRCLHPWVTWHERELHDRVLAYNGAKRGAEYLDFVSGHLFRGDGLSSLHPGLAEDVEALLSEGAGMRPVPPQPAGPEVTAPPRGNLPSFLTSFIGRDDSVTAVVALVAATRLVTLTGAGGSGKTRLAVAVAQRLPSAPAAWFVDLSAVSDGTLVAATVAAALGQREERGRTLEQSIGARLESGPSLLLLDNCEQVAEACAALAASLLAACPRLRVLATSREPLHVTGEVTWPVPPLTVPDIDELPDLAELGRNEAVRLFVERAKAVRPGFALTDENAWPMLRICHRLDGLPLAIELAASRVRVLSPQQIHERLHDCFRLLTGGRGAVPRQQALRATIDWSHDHLDEAESVLFRRLSTFAGTFDLDAVESACAGEELGAGDVLDLLTHLVDKSLVQASERGELVRYRLLHAIRQYAREKLAAAGEEDALLARHRDHFLALAEDVFSRLGSSAETTGFERLERAHDDLRAVLESSLAADPASALRLSTLLRPFWELRGHWSEGREWIHRALERGAAGASPSLRAKALTSEGALAWRQGDAARARPLLEEAARVAESAADPKLQAETVNMLGALAWGQGDLQAARAWFESALTAHRGSGSRRGAAQALNNLGAVAAALGDLEAARSFYEQSLAAKRELGDDRGIAATLNNLGAVLRSLGELTRARSLVDDALARRRALGDKLGVAECLGSQGCIAREMGDLASARQLHEECLELFRQLGDQGGMASELESMGALLLAEGRARDAALVLGAMAALRDSLGTPLLDVAQRRDLEATTARLGEALGADYEAAFGVGGELTLPQAAAIATRRTS